jgi:hypothetical protein
MDKTTGDDVRKEFEGLFARYGLPMVIRSDNGTPFASPNGALGLTTLSAWWISLGIMPDRTEPGSPTQNGSHERMHADMSKEIQGKVPGGVRANQAVIDEWVKEYNGVRPHEALDMKTPAEVYHKSEARYDPTPCDYEYPFGFEAKKIHRNGSLKIRNQSHYISSALDGLTVGLQPNDDGQYIVWLCDFPLGTLDTNLSCFRPQFQK